MFLNNSECKDQLIKMIKQCVMNFGSGTLSRSIPFIITSREKEYFTFISSAENDNPCDNESDSEFLIFFLVKILVINGYLKNYKSKFFI